MFSTQSPPEKYSPFFCHAEHLQLIEHACGETYAFFSTLIDSVDCLVPEHCQRFYANCNSLIELLTDIEIRLRHFYDVNRQTVDQGNIVIGMVRFNENLSIITFVAALSLFIEKIKCCFDTDVSIINQPANIYIRKVCGLIEAKASFYVIPFGKNELLKGQYTNYTIH